MVREITIHPVLNGFVVVVGCQKLVFDSVDALANAVRDYYKDPKGTEARFIEKRVNNTLENPVAPQPPRLTRDIPEPASTFPGRPVEQTCEAECERPTNIVRDPR